MAFEFPFPGSFTSTFLLFGARMHLAGELPGSDSEPRENNESPLKDVYLRAIRGKRERELFIDILLVRNHCRIVMVRWTGLASGICPNSQGWWYLPESPGQNLASTVLYVPYSLDSSSKPNYEGTAA